MQVRLLNCLLLPVLQAMPAVCRGGIFMKKKIWDIARNIFRVVITLAVGFLICLLLQYFLENNFLIPSVLVLCVFLISIYTDGYAYGTLGAIISVVILNYAFTFPYFRINLTMPENVVSVIIMLAITLVTCYLTSKIRYQEQIKAESEKEKMRANLLRAVSHDLRTPLTTIYGASSALLENENEFSEEQKRKLLGGIKEDSQWLCRMVENLLSVTRLDGDNVKIVKTPIPLDELIDAVLVKFHKHYPGVEVEVGIPDELVMIPMDPILMEQVVMNILENAVIHADGMKNLRLEVHTDKGRAVFEIKDDGCGIPEDILEHIFTGGYAGQSEVVDGRKGNAGIGLSVCATIIKAHGGVIAARKLDEGGACFTLALDLEDDNEKQQI